MKKILLAMSVSLLMSAPAIANDSAEAPSSEGKHQSPQEEKAERQHDHRVSQGFPSSSKEEMSHDMEGMKAEEKGHDHKEARQ